MSKGTTKLHELLAVEGSLKTQTDKLLVEHAATFSGKRHLFEEKLVVFQSTEEGGKSGVETQSTLNTTVGREIEFVSEFFTKSLDAALRVADANTRAKADLVITEDDTEFTIATDVPATALLELEKQVAKLRTLVDSIPTLDPAKGFVEDPNKGAGVYRARELRKNRTKKIQKPLVLSPATDKHPAQVQLVSEDVIVGELIETEWSGLITPARKADLLSRVDRLQRAVRSARARANETQVDTSKKIGKRLLEYVFG